MNYRVDPTVVQTVLPAPFRPKCVEGAAVAGICLIRLEAVRPKRLPGWLGISSENSAHRIAVEWDTEDGQTEGVFVPRRDTGSRLNALAGGRVFPGVHHLSRFTVRDEEGMISMKVEPKVEDTPLVELTVRESDTFPGDSVFSTLESSSAFFEAGCIGYSSRPSSCVMDGLLLDVKNWQVSPLEVERVHSAFFDDEDVFPSGSITFDHALLMRDIAHEWHSQPQLKSASGGIL